ncbi:Thaumatin domain-containing protein [Rhizoctonia solani AG-1 IA]|uniref:Thaumatin domain-containing protein n=1 Tax=Thanatephorus cucumeris (strain AG1-IA) TaxID=983506 RepID=L8WMN6_THACA|nr:Thaumatin domain-containing protein [Rhizoctonia solani AG-1 IA]
MDFERCQWARLLLVSLVNSYNLPMRISNNVGCKVAECAANLGLDCPLLSRDHLIALGSPLGKKYPLTPYHSPLASIGSALTTNPASYKQSLHS